MIDALLSVVASWPPELVVMFTAALPIIEVRGAVPLALEVFKMSVWQGAFFAFAGSALSAVVVPLFLARFEEPCRQYIPMCRRLFDWTSTHIERKYTARYRALGAFGLFLFVAVPLPMTGVWTGALAAWVLRMDKRYAIPALVAGTALATIIVSLVSLGFFGAVRAVFLR